MRPDNVRGRTAAAALLCALPLAACESLITAVGGGSWEEQAFGAARVEWVVHDPAGGWTMRPELDGARVYFERDKVFGAGGTLTARAQLVALDRATGAEAWAGPIVTAGNAAVAGNTVAAVWGGLPIFDRATGAPVAVVRRDSSLSGNVASDGARFYVLTHDGHALAIDPATGAAVWDVRVGGTGFGVAVEGDAVAVALKRFGTRAAPGDSGIVAVLDRATGAVRWRVAVGDGRNPGITDPPVIAGGLVVTHSGGHDVRAWDLRTGALRWRFDGGTPDAMHASGVSVCDGRVIATTGSLRMVALDTATGAVRWRVRVDDLGSLSSVECSHGTVLAVGGGLAVHDAATGARRIRFPLREPRDSRRAFMLTAATRDAESLYIATTLGYARITAPGR